MARVTILATIGALAAQAAAGSVIRRYDSTEAFYGHDAKVPSDCSLWWNSDDGLSCSTALLIAGVSVDDLTRLNPSVKSCSDWKADRSYCIEAASRPPSETTPPPVASSTTLPPTTTTQPGNGVQTPEPAQPGMVRNCNRFYKVQSGDTCGKIASSAGVTVAQLAQWNTEIGGTACTGIWVDYHICTGVIGGSPNQPAPTSTQPSNGVKTPEPTQPGMVDNCNRFYQVKSGDTCSKIASSAGVTVAQLAQWNKQIGGTACTGIWADYYLCTGVIGGSATQPPPASNTPQPVQDGMVKDCKKFHLVKSGQNCDTISRQYSITVANFTRWNPAAGNNCQGLWANTYACVGL